MLNTQIALNTLLARVRPQYYMLYNYSYNTVHIIIIKGLSKK